MTMMVSHTTTVEATMLTSAFVPSAGVVRGVPGRQQRRRQRRRPSPRGMTMQAPWVARLQKIAAAALLVLGGWRVRIASATAITRLFSPASVERAYAGRPRTRARRESTFRHSSPLLLAARTGGSMGGSSGFPPSESHFGGGSGSALLPVRPSTHDLRMHSDFDWPPRASSTSTESRPAVRVPATDRRVSWDTLLVGGLAGAAVIDVVRKRQPGSRSAASAESLGDVLVARIHVALRDEAKRYVREVLQELSDTADTSTADGLAHLARVTALTLLRAQNVGEGWFASAHDSDRFPADRVREAERKFRRMTLEVRRNWKQDTRLNVQGVRRQVSRADGSGPRVAATAPLGMIEDFMVVSITAAIVACSPQVIKTPPTTDNWLERLGSVQDKELRAVEVSWTPDEDDDPLDHDELMAKFPWLMDGDGETPSSLPPISDA
eukprot:ctg_1194.g268